jgi:hypothetical protein
MSGGMACAAHGNAKSRVWILPRPEKTLWHRMRAIARGSVIAQRAPTSTSVRKSRGSLEGQRSGMVRKFEGITREMMRKDRRIVRKKVSWHTVSLGSLDSSMLVPNWPVPGQVVGVRPESEFISAKHSLYSFLRFDVFAHSPFTDVSNAPGVITAAPKCRRMLRIHLENLLAGKSNP